jgi:hypothetical protein
MLAVKKVGRKNWLVVQKFVFVISDWRFMKKQVRRIEMIPEIDLSRTLKKNWKMALCVICYLTWKGFYYLKKSSFSCFSFFDKWSEVQ